MTKRGFTLLFSYVLLFSVAAEAAVIRGTVVEKRSGYSLSRATITLEPIGLSLQPPRTARTSDGGIFEFGNLAAGAYIVTATRRGFMPMQYGQKRWNSAGTAILVGGDEVVSLHFPLSRFGAITGTVRDMNEVGIPDQDVAAYSSTEPPHYVARARSDDRGVFRITGLEPGTYLVRTTGNNDEERAYLPTFSRQTLRVEEARPIVVYPDEDSGDGDVRPIAGTLFDLSGAVTVLGQGAFNITVTLASDMGRTTSNGPAFRYTGLAPGHYEIYAEAREALPGTRTFGAYTDVQLQRNQTNFLLPLYEVRESQFVVDGAPGGIAMSAMLRRKDLAGVGATESYPFNANNRVQLFPGRWELFVAPPDNTYVSRVSGSRGAAARPEGWNEIVVSNYNRVAITLSTGAGGVRGVVRSSNAPVVGAPVFLETWDPVTRKRLLDLRETRTDMRGNYRFAGLPPGDYRILSTYEYAAPDPAFLDAAGAQTIHVDANASPAVDLELYGIP